MSAAVGSKRSKAVLAVALAFVLAFSGVFLAQPETLRVERTRRSEEQNARYTGADEGDGDPPAPASTVAASVNRYDPAVVEKKAFSSRMRIAFLVGLEGTGHHYLADVLEEMCQTASVPCPKVCHLANALYPDLALSKSAIDYGIARKMLRQEMETLAAFPTKNMTEGTATIASFAPCRFKTGMMSYPNFNGPDKALQYVDFRLLAEEAERAGVDVRFVYLSRSARAILVSDTQHNDYGGSFMKESRILLTNAAVMESFFREVDPGFTTCLRYEDLADPGQAARVSQFLGPTDYVAQRLGQKMLEHVKGRSLSPVAPASGGPTGQGSQEHTIGGSRPRFERSGGPSRAGSHGHLRRRLGNEASKSWQQHGGGANPSKDMIIARLQQKLDRIEMDVCNTAAASGGGGSA